MLLISCVSPCSHPLVSLALSSLSNLPPCFLFCLLSDHRSLPGFFVQLGSLYLFIVPTQIQCCLFPPLLHCSCVLDLSVVALRLSNTYFHVQLDFPVLFCGSLDCAHPLPVFTTGVLCYAKTQKASFLQTRTSYFYDCVPLSSPKHLPVFHSKEYFFRCIKALQGYTGLPRTDKVPAISFPSKGNRKRYCIKKLKNKSRFICCFSSWNEFRCSVAVAGRSCKCMEHVKFPGLNSIHSLN